MKLGFIVEGTNDAWLLERMYPGVVAVSTRGTRLDNRARFRIDDMIMKVDMAFLMVDPDEAGTRYGELILKEFDLPQIHLDPKECMCYRAGKWKCGVEHANEDYLRGLINAAIEKKLQIN